MMLSWRLQFKGTFLFLSLIRRFIFLLSVNFIYIKCDVFIKYYFLLLKTSSLFRWLDVEVCLCKILFLENFINFQLWVLSVISSYWKKIEKEMKFWIWNLLTELSEQWTVNIVSLSLSDSSSSALPQFLAAGGGGGGDTWPDRGEGEAPCR